MLVTLLIVLAVVGIFLAPAWPYSTGWGYTPISLVGVVLAVLIILLLLGFLPTSGRLW